VRSVRVIPFLVLVVACTAAPVSTASPTPLATVAASASPIASPSATPTATAATFAAICGTISDFVGDSAQTNGSFVLNSPGRAPIRITIPAGRLGGSAAGYVCVEVLAGSPHPLFAGFFTSGTPGFVASGTVPATTAFPLPKGFVLPQACAYVVPPAVGPDQIEWKVDCGSANDDARGTLGPALTQQGWVSCGSGLGAAQWRKNDVMLTVAESSLAPGDYPRITQFARVISSCS